MNTFLFDLDGTLLPMPSQQKFLESYMKALSGKVISYGLNPQKLVKAVMTGTEYMVRNDGSMTNKDRFWSVVCQQMGNEIMQMEGVFDNFYRNEFLAAKETTSIHPLAKFCISLLQEKGYHIVLATNPLFPRIATLTRIGWAGLDPMDFDLITTYEDSTYCKPNLEYYKEVLSAIKRKPEECIMVGNDVTEDMCTSQLGMETFLLKDCLICPEGEDIATLKQGDFNDLYDMIKNLPDIC